MTDFVNKYPMHALDFKKKLADKIKDQEDMKLKNETKQQLAHEKRLQYLNDKAAKFRGFVQKVEEVKAAQHQLAIDRKNRIEMKLKNAEENRKNYLDIIKRKAHDEEEKLKEIAFINELEAQNRRHDSLALRQEHEERLQYLVEERQRRLEEKAAKEAAVEERRKALEAERMEKVELLKEKRRMKEEIIDRKQQEKEKERLVIVREKAREREERMRARHTARLANLEELQKRIKQKQEESTRRHVECIELIRQKAVDAGIHRNLSEGIINMKEYFNRHAASQKSENINGDVSHNQNKNKSMKKRFKKIKSRMATRGNSYTEKRHGANNVSSKESVIEKLMTKLMKYKCNEVYMWETKDCTNIDRSLEEVICALHENPLLGVSLIDMKVFLHFDSIISIFNNTTHSQIGVSTLRCVIKVITICDFSCLENRDVCLYFLQTNIIATFIDTLKFSLLTLDEHKTWELLVELLLRFHTVLLNVLNEMPANMIQTIPDFSSKMKDLISYILCTGVVNRLIDLLRPSIPDEKFIYGSLIVPTILFFKRLLSSWFISDELVNILKSTDLLGTVPLLYEGLLKCITNRDEPPEYCKPTISLFMKLAELDLKSFQDILGADNIALQWRGIASSLMTYCAMQNKFEDCLLNPLIELVGYFAIHNKKNQTLLQSGKQPTILQQLTKLPFRYFCDAEYMQHLFPALISCSFNNDTNKAIIRNEIDYIALENFMKSDAGKDNCMIKMIIGTNEGDSKLNYDEPVTIDGEQ